MSTVQLPWKGEEENEGHGPDYLNCHSTAGYFTNVSRENHRLSALRLEQYVHQIFFSVMSISMRSN